MATNKFVTIIVEQKQKLIGGSMFNEETNLFLGNLGLDQEEVAEAIRKSGLGLHDILNKKTCMIKGRVSPLQKYYIEKKAEDKGCNVTELIVNSTIYPENVNKKSKAIILTAVNRLGNNYNQTLRQMYIEGFDFPRLIEVIEENNRHIEALVNTFGKL